MNIVVGSLKERKQIKWVQHSCRLPLEHVRDHGGGRENTSMASQFSLRWGYRDQSSGWLKQSPGAEGATQRKTTILKSCVSQVRCSRLRILSCVCVEWNATRHSGEEKNVYFSFTLHVPCNLGLCFTQLLRDRPTKHHHLVTCLSPDAAHTASTHISWTSNSKVCLKHLRQRPRA